MSAALRKAITGPRRNREKSEMKRLRSQRRSESIKQKHNFESIRTQNRSKSRTSRVSKSERSRSRSLQTRPRSQLRSLSNAKRKMSREKFKPTITYDATKNDEPITISSHVHHIVIPTAPTEIVSDRSRLHPPSTVERESAEKPRLHNPFSNSKL